MHICLGAPAHSSGLCLCPETRAPLLSAVTSTAPVFLCCVPVCMQSCRGQVCASRYVRADVHVWLCHRRVKLVQAGLWGPRSEHRVLAGCMHVRPAVCAPTCPPCLNIPEGVGVRAGGCMWGRGGHSSCCARWDRASPRVQRHPLPALPAVVTSRRNLRACRRTRLPPIVPPSSGAGLGTGL